MSGLSYIQVNKHGVTVAYHLHQRKDLAQHAILYAKVGKGGIKCKNTPLSKCCRFMLELPLWVNSNVFQQHLLYDFYKRPPVIGLI